MGMLCKIFKPPFLKNIRDMRGGAAAPPPADFKHLQTLPVIGLRFLRKYKKSY